MLKLLMIIHVRGAGSLVVDARSFKEYMRLACMKVACLMKPRSRISDVISDKTR